MQAKEESLDKPMALMLPGKHQVSLICPKEVNAVTDCALQTIDVNCGKDKQNEGGVCRVVCADEGGLNEVLTKEGSCTKPMIKAAVQSNTLAVKLQKPNPHLVPNGETDFITPNASIAVGPSAKYDLKWTQHLAVEGNLSWIRVEGGTQLNEYRWEVPLSFDATNLTDGTVVNATLSFVGQSGNVTAEADTVQISGRVVSTPSLQLSEITVPTEVEFGTPLSIFITAIDVDDHQIQNTNGRSFVLVVEGAGKVKNYVSTSQQGSAKFQVEVPSADLKVGDYKVPSACLPDALVSP